MKKLLSLSLTLCFVLFAFDAYAQSLVGNPTSNDRQTSPFGWRNSTNSNHLAVDYGATSAGVSGDNVFSTVSGTVVESRYQTNSSHSGGWGNTVLIESNSGNYRVRYSHLENPGLANGSTVGPGDTVGQMGGTGRAGGYATHLDYAVYVKDPTTGEFHAIDPNEAQGVDLDDPEARQQLIDDAKTKVNGELRSEGAPQGANSDDPSTGGGSAGGSDSGIIGCDPSIFNNFKAKKEALQQMETEAAKALIGKPTSVMQTSCFEQYTQRVSEIGGIHSKPGANISGSIIPNVQMPAINFTVENFLSNALSGGIQSALNTAMGDAFNGLMNSVTGGLSGALGGLTGGGAGGGSGCNMMDEMWKILQCVDFPKMPGLSDILGGKLDKVDGVLKGLGDLANGKGIMGAVCQAASSMFGSEGGGSGSTSVYENALNASNEEPTTNDSIYSQENIDALNDALEETASGEEHCTESNWVYNAGDIARLDVLTKNNQLDANEFVLFDTNGNCQIEEDEILYYEGELPLEDEETNTP